MRLADSLIAALCSVIATLCVIVPSGNGTALKYQANSDNLRHVGHNETRNSTTSRVEVPVPVGHQALRSAADTQTQDNKEKHSEWLEPIVLVTAAYVIVSCLMLRAISKQGEQVERQIGLADAQRVEMVQQSDHMRRQWRTMHEQDITLREQVAEMERQATATKDAATAAQKSVNALIDIERPWIRVLVPVNQMEVPPLPHSISRPFVNIWPRVDSVGRTPARTKYIVFKAHLIPKDPTLPLNVPPRLPDTPDYDGGISTDKHCLVVQGTGITPMPVSVTVEDWDAIKKRDLFLYVYGFVEYYGVGTDDRSSGFCNIYWVPYGKSDPQPEMFLTSANIPDSYMWDT